MHTVAEPQAAARLQAVLAVIERHKEQWSLLACAPSSATRLARTRSGSVARCRRATSSVMSSIRPALRSNATGEARRPTGSMRSTGDDPARVAARRARAHARGSRTFGARRGVAPADARSQGNAEGSCCSIATGCAHCLVIFAITSGCTFQRARQLLAHTCRLVPDLDTRETRCSDVPQRIVEQPITPVQEHRVDVDLRKRYNGSSDQCSRGPAPRPHADGHRSAPSASPAGGPYRVGSLSIPVHLAKHLSQ